VDRVRGEGVELFDVGVLVLLVLLLLVFELMTEELMEEEEEDGGMKDLELVEVLVDRASGLLE
jgi:hypothetical protein